MPPIEKTKKLIKAILERWGDDGETARLAQMRKDTLDFVVNAGLDMTRHVTDGVVVFLFCGVV